MRYLLLLPLLMLGACAGPEPIHPPTLAQLQAQCRAYGFAPGSDALATCVQREVIAWNQHMDWMSGY